MEPTIENQAAKFAQIQNGQVLSLPEFLAIFSLGDDSDEDENARSGYLKLHDFSG